MAGYGQNGYGYPQGRAPRNSGPRGGGQQRPDQESNIGQTLFNNQIGKFLDFNYWGRYASIEIGAVAPGAGMDWESRKNAQRTRQVIPFDALSDLWDICEEVMESVKNTGTFTSAGVKVGGKQDAMVEINNGSTLNMSPGIYLVIYKNMDSGNRTNNLEVYPFDHSHIIRGYDHSTGMAKDDIAKIGQFKKFYRLIKEATKAFTMAQAHAIQAIQRNDRLSSFLAISAVAAALGVDTGKEIDRTLKGQDQSRGGQSSGGRGGYGGGRNYGAPRSGGSWANNRPQGGTFEQPAQQTNDFQRQQQIMATMDDPVDINLSMDNLTNVDMSQFK